MNTTKFEMLKEKAKDAIYNLFIGNKIERFLLMSLVSLLSIMTINYIINVL